MDIPPELRYSSDHEWVRVEEERARVGITDYAQDALGDVVFVDLPEAGAKVTRGESCCEVESTKSVSEVYAPLDGTIVEINGELADNPQRLNDDPYGDGWMFVIDPLDAAQLGDLLDAEGYRALIEG
jgi:glycine cleavage system H protein